MTPTQQPTQLTNQPTTELSDMTSPYRGLTPYTEADAAYFFGRTAEIATITANLEVARLTLFYGPSGVGKSSVLRAGVIHDLHQRAQATFAATGVAEQIPVYFNRWASDPLLGLSQTLAQTVAPYCLHPTAPHPQPTAPLLAQLQHWSEQTDSELLLVLDQFEEFFQYHTQPGSPTPSQPWDPTSFAAQLVQIINHSALRVHLLLSLREDTLARLDYFQGRIPFLLDNRLSIGHLDRAAGEEAVVKPLARFNQEQQTHYTIEPALVTAVLDQVSNGQVALSKHGAGGRTDTTTERVEAPYLQLVLERLWEQEKASDSTQLRQTTLDRLGGATMIVRNYLDNTLDALTDNERSLAARFFDRLVTPSGAKIALTLNELAHYAGAEPSRVEQVVQQLQDRRLLRGMPISIGETQYEIFHDVLSQALLDWQVRYQELQEEEARLAKEKIARAQAEADARDQAKTAARLRRFVFGLIITLFIAVAFMAFALIQTRLVTGANLALEARQSVRDQNLRLATLLAIEAHQLNPAQGERVLEIDIPFQIPFSRRQQLSGHTDAVTSVAWRPDGRRLASASWDNSIIIWDGNTNEVIRRLNGHKDDVLNVTWHPNGKQLASASKDNSVIVWNTETGEPIHILRRHSERVVSVAWKPDGQQLASASWDNSVIIWDSDTGAVVYTFQGNKTAVVSVAWRPDGQQLASASWDNKITIWDTKTNLASRILQGHADHITSLAWQPNGQRLASASLDNSIIVWDINTGKSTNTLHKHTNAVVSIAWQPEGQQLASASWDKSIIVWNVELEEAVNIFSGHRDAVVSVAWRPNGQQLASASWDNSIILWDMGTSSAMSLKGHQNAVESVAWQPNGNQLASASQDDSIIIWDTKTGAKVHTLQAHNRDVVSVVWRPDGQQLASASLDNTVIIWDAKTGTKIHTLIGHTNALVRVAWRSDGRHLVSTSVDNTVIIWDIDTGKLVHTFFNQSDLFDIISAVWEPDDELTYIKTRSKFFVSMEWRPNKPHLALTSKDHSIIIWDAERGELVNTLVEHDSFIMSITWHPDGQQLASVSSNKVIIWNVETSTVSRILQFRESIVGLAWQPDGRLIVAIVEDDSIITWDVEHSELIHTYPGNGKALISIAWQPDGRQLAATFNGGDTILWDMESGELVHRLQGHSKDVMNITWRPDGQYLASASRDNSVIIRPWYYLEPPCNWVESNLSIDEWIRYRGWILYQPTCPNRPSPHLPEIADSLIKGHPEYLLLSMKGLLLLIVVTILMLLFLLLFIEAIWQFPLLFYRRY